MCAFLVVVDEGHHARRPARKGRPDSSFLGIVKTFMFSGRVNTKRNKEMHSIKKIKF